MHAAGPEVLQNIADQIFGLIRLLQRFPPDADFITYVLRMRIDSRMTRSYVDGALTEFVAYKEAVANEEAFLEYEDVIDLDEYYGSFYVWQP